MPDSDNSNMGRPPKPPEHVRKNKLEIRLSDVEQDLVNEAVGRNISTWARELIIRAAKRMIRKK